MTLTPCLLKCQQLFRAPITRRTQPRVNNLYIFLGFLVQIYYLPSDLLHHCMSLVYFSWAMAYFHLFLIFSLTIELSNLSQTFWGLKITSSFITVRYQNYFNLSISYCVSPQIALAYLFHTYPIKAFLACFLFIFLLSSVGLTGFCFFVCFLFLYMFLLTPLPPQVSGKFLCMFPNQIH